MQERRYGSLLHPRTGSYPKISSGSPGAGAPGDNCGGSDPPASLDRTERHLPSTRSIKPALFWRDSVLLNVVCW